MERGTLSPSLSLISLFGFLLYYRILNCTQIYYSKIQRFLQIQLDIEFGRFISMRYDLHELSSSAEPSSGSGKKLCNNNETVAVDASVDGKRMVVSDDNVGKLYVGDVEMVMNNLGLGVFCNHFDAKQLHDQRLNSVQFLNLFAVDEPSLTELKKAFDLFDQNRDGFIDDRELQDVLFKLGLKEERDIKECRRMIRVFDDNGDGRIDFNEFVKCMEKSFE